MPGAAANAASDDTTSTYPRRSSTDGSVARTVWNTPSTLTSMSALESLGIDLSTDP